LYLPQEVNTNKRELPYTQTVNLAGGVDPLVNTKLGAVLNRAKAASMPKDSIENALKRSADKNKEDLEEVLYECVGPSGTALIV
jgi:transcriptional/translational regulatory protein YebC/TACO1